MIITPRVFAGLNLLFEAAIDINEIKLVTAASPIAQHAPVSIC